MNPKFRLLDIGSGAFIELDGKTMGRGVSSVEYSKDGHQPAKLSINIDLDDFEFMQDGYLDEVMKKLEAFEAPSTTQDE